MDFPTIEKTKPEQKMYSLAIIGKRHILFLLLIIFILLIVVSVLGLQNYMLKQSLESQTKKVTQSNTSQSNSKSDDWILFQSTRVPFSFKHPPDYELGVHSNSHVYQFEDLVEAINLGTLDALPNAGGPAKGYIIVERYGISDGISEEDRILNPYRKNYEYFKEQKLKQGETNIPTEDEYLPNLTKSKVGNAEAYLLTTNEHSQSAFSPTLTKFFIFRRGLLYTVGITTNDDIEVAIIEEILQTFDFMY